jgi:hypothetical protein
MTNILIPTDFTAASLRMAENAVRNGNYNRCNLILFHAFSLPSNPFDLLGATHRDPSCELINEGFRQACKQVKDVYAKQVNKIVVRCMTGDTKAVFRNFAEANDIDLIYCPDDYFFTPVHTRSIDPLPLFRQCGIPVITSAGKRAEPQFDNNGYYPSMQMSTQ